MQRRIRGTPDLAHRSSTPTDFPLTARGRARLSRAAETPQDKLVRAIGELSSSDRRSLSIGLRRLVSQMKLSSAPPAMFFEKGRSTPCQAQVSRHAPGKTGAIPIAPSMGPTITSLRLPTPLPTVGPRTIWISALAIAVGTAATGVALALTRLIGTHRRILRSLGESDCLYFPGIGAAWPLGDPCSRRGGLIVGVMARFGSKAIRGHGIPEAMEQFLERKPNPGQDHLPQTPLRRRRDRHRRPFWRGRSDHRHRRRAGSLVRPMAPLTADRRKRSWPRAPRPAWPPPSAAPVSAVLLAIELLLFEFRPRSIIPVALATSTAAALRMAFVGAAPVFPMTDLAQPGGAALTFYVVLGAAVGIAATFITRAVYAVEDAFESSPSTGCGGPLSEESPWGLLGHKPPYVGGTAMTTSSASFRGAGRARPLALLPWKFFSWAISLGSGTSGGTLAPLFTLGGGLGSAIASGVILVAPGLGVDPRLAALVGMATIFAGASRAMLASVLFAFETTRQPLALLPLLGGCAAASLASFLGMRHSIMTEKLARRGTRVPADYTADFLDQVRVEDFASLCPVPLSAQQALADAGPGFTPPSPGALIRDSPSSTSTACCSGDDPRATDRSRDLPKLLPWSSCSSVPPWWPIQTARFVRPRTKWYEKTSDGFRWCPERRRYALSASSRAETS